MALIEVAGLIKNFGDKVAVRDLSFEVDEGEILVIVGASGCGKTTTLRSIAGLETPTRGTIRFDGRTIVSERVYVPPEKRGMGMVFQSYALWPHKTVGQNVAYPLVVGGRRREEIRDSVAQALDLVGLSGLEKRLPSTLSGGQQQRVALARCAVAQPRVLLLDEPLSNLDAKLREQMQSELRHLIRSLQSTAIHITHDQTEAMAIADRIIVMRDGAIEQSGTPRQVYRRPVNRFVGEFIGIASFLQGSVAERRDGHICVAVSPEISFWAQPSVPEAKDGEVTLCVRPEDVHLAREPMDGTNSYDGRVTEANFLGSHTEYLVELFGVALKSRSNYDFELGEAVHVHVDPQRLVAIGCTPADATG